MDALTPKCSCMLRKWSSSPRVGPQLCKFELPGAPVAYLKQPDHVKGRGVTSSYKTVTGFRVLVLPAQTGASKVIQENRPKVLGSPTVWFPDSTMVTKTSPGSMVVVQTTCTPQTPPGIYFLPAQVKSEWFESLRSQRAFFQTGVSPTARPQLAP